MSSDIVEHIEACDPPTQGISVKCRAKRLVELIPKLNDAQRSAISRIGFGGILELKFTNFPLAHVPLFMHCFMDGSYVFRTPHLKEFMVSKHDVHDCFLLPMGPKDLDLVPTGQQKGSNSPENKALKDRWRKRFGIQTATGCIPIGKIKSAIEADQEGGDDFCTLWVLLCMSSFLAPTSNDGVDFKLLRAAEDVSNIRRMDWCSYVLNAMVTAGEDVKKRHRHLLGCIPFLMITYFQRFDYRGSICAHDLPLIKHWDEARIKSRINGELADGGLGRQTWSVVKYPRCIHSPANILNNVSGDSQLRIMNAPSSDCGKKFIQIELPPGVDDDEKLKEMAVDPVHELYLKIQRNASAFYAWYSDAISRIKRITTETIDPPALVPSQSTQEFFQGDAVHRYCVQVEDAERIKRSISNAPVLHDVRSGMMFSTEKDRIASLKLSQVLSALKKDGCSGENDDTAKTSVGKISSPHLSSKGMVGCSEVRLGLDVEQLSQEDHLKLSDRIFTEAEIEEAFRMPTSEPEFDEVIDSAVFYNTAEINEVLECNKKTTDGPNVPRPSYTAKDDSERAILKESGYSPADIDAYFKVQESTRVVPDIDVVDLGEDGEGRVREANDPVGDGSIPPPSVVVPQTDMIHNPQQTPDPKRIFDDENQCEITYKRRRSSPPNNFMALVEAASAGEPLSALSSRRRGRGDGLGCSLVCNEVTGATLKVVSNFLRNNQTLFKDVKDLRKHVADYSFLDDNSMSNVEQLADFGPNAKLRRQDIISMLPEYYMSDFVIECWAMLLNYIESEDCEVPRMAFFGTRHTDVLLVMMDTSTQCTPGDSTFDRLYEIWDTFVKDCGRNINLDANLIFIPINIDYHVACVCINFNSNTVDILDNQRHPHLEKSSIGKAASVLVSAMSDYLEYKGVTKGCQITSFEHRQIMFDWTRPDPKDKESGIFTMVHMLMYEGEPFKHNDLDSKVSRRYLILQLAATLILADMNKNQAEVLGKVTPWIAKKGDILKSLFAKRKLDKLMTKPSSSK